MFPHCYLRRCVDAHSLQDGLENLGIGITTDVAHALVRLVGNDTSASFRLRDLASFCANYDSSSGRLHGKLPSPMNLATVNPPDNPHGADSTERVPSILERSPDGVADEAITRGSDPDLTRVTTPTDAVSSCGRGQKFSPRKGVKNQRVLKTEDSTQEDAPPFAWFEVSKAPHRISGPAVAAFARSKQSNISQTNGWGDLPCWVRESSKMALRQLMGRHIR